MKKIELLSPAGNREALIAAVQNGADAVYLGGQSLNARRGAGNFDADGLRAAADYCHERGVKVHITVNTLLKQREAAQLEELAEQIARAGVDAAIVQDLGVALALSEMLPELCLHASTQMAVHNPQGVRTLKQWGIQRAVLARELQYEEIAQCAREGLEIEVFAHGALCVSGSGQCLFSSMVGGRSGNRGLCAQPCRMKYSLVGPEKERTGYLLSPRDLMSVDRIPELAACGVDSIKIEGRLKRPEYVAVVTAAYRRALDVYAEKGERLSDPELEDALRQIFSRGGFTRGYAPGVVDKELMEPERPSHTGIRVGKVLSAGRGNVEYRLEKDIAAQDAIVGRSARGEDVPLRAASGQAGQQYRLKYEGGLKSGDILYRMAQEKQLKAARLSCEGEHRQRALNARLTLRCGQNAGLALEQNGLSVQVEGELVELAHSSGMDRGRLCAQLQKTGGTPYKIEGIEIQADERAFVPVSALNELRRRALEAFRQRLLEAARGCDRAVSKTEVFRPEGGASPGEVCLAVQSDRTEILEQAAQLGVERLYLAPADIRESALEKLSEWVERYKPFLVLPMVMNGQALETLNRWALRNERHIRGVLLSNVGQLALDWPGERLGDYPLNVFNAAALKRLKQMGLTGYTASVEATCQELEEMDSSGMARELIVYGRIELMQLRHCPMRAQLGGPHSACRRCDQGRKLDEYALEDRMGMRFPLKRLAQNGGCVVKVLNSVPLCVLDKRALLPAAKVHRLIIGDETVSQLARLIQAARGLEELKIKSTSGHYFRGVE